MSATTQKKARPKFKVDQFRDIAIEARGMEVGVDLELSAGVYEVKGTDDDGNETVIDTVTVEDGDIVHVPHPLMLSDPDQDRFDEFNEGKDLDLVEYHDEESGETKTRPAVPYTINGEPAPGSTYRMARAILGETELHRLLAGGGHSNDVAIAWQYLTRDSRLDRDPKAQKPRR